MISNYINIKIDINNAMIFYNNNMINEADGQSQNNEDDSIKVFKDKIGDKEKVKKILVELNILFRNDSNNDQSSDEESKKILKDILNSCKYAEWIRNYINNKDFMNSLDDKNKLSDELIKKVNDYLEAICNMDKDNAIAGKTSEDDLEEFIKSDEGKKIIETYKKEQGQLDLVKTVFLLVGDDLTWKINLKK